MEELLSVHGIGEKRAAALMRAGVTCKKDLLKPEFSAMLTTESKLFIENPVASKIPAEIVNKLKQFIVKRSARVTIAGSYRRGKPFVRDIDIIINCDIGKFIEHLTRAFSIICYANGEKRASVLLRKKERNPLPRNEWLKADIFFAPADEYHAMLLYSTGSGEFNVMMRSVAKRKGLLLNQHGLFNIKTGMKVPTKTERDIFRALGMKYTAPRHREIAHSS